MRPSTFLLALLAALLCASTSVAQRSVVVARVQPEKIYVGEVAEYLVWAFGATEATVLTPPSSSGVELVYEGGQSVRFDMFDVMTRRVPSDHAFQMKWRLRAESPGRVAIEPPKVRIGSREIEANRVTLEVVGTTPSRLAFCEVSTDFPRVLRSQRARLHADFYFAGIGRDRDAEPENPFDYLARISGFYTESDGRNRREYRTLPMEVNLPWLPKLPDGLNAGDPRDWIDGLLPVNEFRLPTPFRGGGLLGGNLSLPLPRIERVEHEDEGGTKRIYFRVRYTCEFEANAVGRYEIAPATLRGTTVQTVGSQVTRAELYVRSEPLVIEVVEPPEEGRPANWTGAIGTFEFVVGKPTPEEVNEGDVVFLTATVRGRGQLAGVRLDLEEQAGFAERFQVLEPEVLAPLPQGSEVPPNYPDHEGDWRQFEFQLIPLHADVGEVPPIRFSYFDPEQGDYRTLVSPAHPIVVKKRARGEVVVATEEKPSTRFVEIEEKDAAGLAPIVADLNVLGNERVDPLPYALFLLACPVLYVAFAWPVMRSRRRHADPKARRRGEALKNARAVLAEARETLGKDRTLALELAARSARQLIADVCAVSLESVGARDVLDYGKVHGLEEARIRGLEALFADAEAAAFAGAPPGEAKTNEHLDELEVALAALHEGSRSRSSRARAKQALASIVVGSFLALPSNAQEAIDREDLFQRAERRYAQEDFRGAAELYERILTEGYENGAVLYNLGNAWFRAGELGRAIAAYRRAERYLPDDRNLNSNLERARSQRIQVFEREDRVDLTSYLLFWRDSQSLRTQLMLTCLLAGLTLVIALLNLFVLRSRRLWPYLSLGILKTLLLALGSYLTWEEQRPGRHAVIVANETPLRQGASAAFESQAELVEGTEVRVLGSRTGEAGSTWLQVKIGENSGFVPAEKAVVY